MKPERWCIAAWRNAGAVDEKGGSFHDLKMEWPLSQIQDLKFSLVCARVENVFDFRGGQGAFIDADVLQSAVEIMSLGFPDVQRGV